MRIQTAILCDAANTREGLLNVLSGGITRAYRPTLPAPLGVSLALIVEVDADQFEMPHEVTVQINDPQDVVLGKVVAAFQHPDEAPTPRLEPGEPFFLPVAIPLHAAITTRYGRHSIRVRVDESDPQIRVFYVLSPEELRLPPLI